MNEPVLEAEKQWKPTTTTGRLERDPSESVRSVRELTRDEWVRWQWFDDGQPFNSKERILLRGLERTPEEAAQADKDYDVFERLWPKESKCEKCACALPPGGVMCVNCANRALVLGPGQRLGAEAK